MLPGEGRATARLAPDVAADLETNALAAVAAAPADGVSLAELRPALVRSLRRAVTVDRALATAVVADTIDALVADGRLARSGDRIHLPGAGPAGLPPSTLAAMDRLERALAVPAPPPLDEAAAAVGCPPDGVRALQAAGRIVVLDDGLAYEAATFDDLAATAVRLATAAPLSPAALRDATRNEPALCHGDPRGARPARSPPPDAGRPRPRTQGHEMTAGIVLAGGRSSRYGADKLAVSMPDGRSLLAWTVAAVADASDMILVVVDPTSPVPEGLPVDAVTLRDASAFEGPVAGLAIALEWLAGSAAPDADRDDDIAVVVAGDMPTLVPAVLRALVDALEQDAPAGGLATAPDCARLEAELQRDGSTMAVFPFAVRRDPARAAVEAALRSDERRMRSALGRLTTTVLPAAEWRPLDPDGSDPPGRGSAVRPAGRLTRRADGRGRRGEDAEGSVSGRDIRPGSGR